MEKFRRLPLLPAFAAALLLTSACEPNQRPASEAATPNISTAPTPPVPQPAPATAVTPAVSAAEKAYYTLGRGFLGTEFIRLNMTEEQLRQKVPADRLKRITRESEGIEYPAYELRNPQYPDAPPVILELAEDLAGRPGLRIWRIEVRDPRYRTGKGGIGVGSTFGEARQAYGIQTVEQADAGLIAVSESVSMSWILDPTGIPQPTGRPLLKDDVPPGTRIIGVLLFR
ncbi:hypothetical protein [Hymenobacter koreensis]|uniref:Uncharacterized protein n=1 Tax=Hymenobacter koreensis TaxID=1084523 RepID=A0ABP8J9A9_9BACT